MLFHPTPTMTSAIHLTQAINTTFAHNPVGRLCLLLFVLVAMPNTGYASDNSNPANIIIRFSHSVANKAPKGMMALRFKQLAEQRLPNRVKVKIYPRSLMYRDSNVATAIANGDVELAAPALSKLRSMTPKLQVFDLPFLFPDMAAVDAFQKSQEGLALLYSMEQHNVIGVGYLHNGMKQLSGNSPIHVPGDLTDKRYRIMNSKVIKAQFEAARAITEVRPFSDVYSLLQKGDIDGQENTWSNIYASHFFRVQQHITESNHGVLDYMVITSPKFWNGLPPEVRTVLDACLREAIAYGNQIAAKKSAQNRNAIHDSGLTTLYTLNDTQRQQWVQTMQPVWGQFSHEIGEDLIKAALRAGYAP